MELSLIIGMPLLMTLVSGALTGMATRWIREGLLI